MEISNYSLHSYYLLDDIINILENFCIEFNCYALVYFQIIKYIFVIVLIGCGVLNRAKEKIKFDQLLKLQKKEDVSVTYEELIKKVKINVQNIFSQIWKEKVKAHKEEIRCLDSRKIDSMLVAQQGQDWWQNFNSTMKEINRECEKII